MSEKKDPSVTSVLTNRYASFICASRTSYKSVRVAVPCRLRKKTLRVRRAVGVDYEGVGWGVGMVGRSAVKHKNSGIIKGVDQISLPQEEIHRLVLQPLPHRQPSILCSV